MLLSDNGEEEDAVGWVELEMELLSAEVFYFLFFLFIGEEEDAVGWVELEMELLSAEVFLFFIFFIYW